MFSPFSFSVISIFKFSNFQIFKLKNGYHIPVLYHETLEGLSIKPDGVYVDCTFGGGGHSRGILAQLNEKGKLFAFDQDADAQKNIPDDSRVVFVPQNFRHLQRFLRLHEVQAVDGILADLGVSSHQFDEGDRGFSIRFSGPLDMRMDRRQSLSAADIVKGYTEQQLHKLFEQYGEVSNSKTLAKQIVQQRHHIQVQTIEQFKALISPVVKGNPNKYLAQVFQALRMEVNDEMGALKEMLQQVPAVLPEQRVQVALPVPVQVVLQGRAPVMSQQAQVVLPFLVVPLGSVPVMSQQAQVVFPFLVVPLGSVPVWFQ